ncbi:MAG: multicopper oxidase family protein [Methylophilaceae bacterium]|nr:copper oxidase [Methyloradius sp.]
MTTRRQFLSNAGMAILSAGLVSRAGAASLPEAPMVHDALTQAPLQPNNGQPYNPVITLNGWTLPWRMKNGVKEFHLIAEPVVREIAPGMKANLWGYNGQSPGPTIEVVEGDRVRLFVTNKLPENTSIHWHGQRLQNGMDGVSGLTQPSIPVGKTYVYEFVAKRPGTFMYHPHADEMLQMAMGLMGFWVTHPKSSKNELIAQVDRDFCFLLNAYDIAPGSATPKVNTMTDFNLWTFNSRAFPGIDPLVVRQNDKVRIRVGNLTMTNHPIHLHGHEFMVTGSDGGPWPKAARHPEVTTDIAVGQMRQIEFIADAEGDWALHCHKAHHTMNAMGHQVPTMIGVDQSAVAAKISTLLPDYMAMGESGGSDMADMGMPIPENTLPMMAGEGPFGAIEMGGMFTMLKVRKNQPKNDYKDPGWYQHPQGQVAYEWTGSEEALPPAEQAHDAMQGMKMDDSAPMHVHKPGMHMEH